MTNYTLILAAFSAILTLIYCFWQMYKKKFTTDGVGHFIYGITSFLTGIFSILVLIDQAALTIKLNLLGIGENSVLGDLAFLLLLGGGMSIKFGWDELQKSVGRKIERTEKEDF